MGRLWPVFRYLYKINLLLILSFRIWIFFFNLHASFFPLFFIKGYPNIGLIWVLFSLIFLIGFFGFIVKYFFYWKFCFVVFWVYLLLVGLGLMTTITFFLCFFLNWFFFKFISFNIFFLELIFFNFVFSL